MTTPVGTLAGQGADLVRALTAELGGRPGGDVLLTEVLVDAGIEMLAARSALAAGPQRTLSSSANQVLTSVVEWQAVRTVLTALGDLTVGLGQVGSDSPLLTEVDRCRAWAIRLGGTPQTLIDELIDDGVASEALALVRRTASQLGPWPDIAESLTSAVDALDAALPDEWAEPGPVRLAGAPYLLTPLGQLLLANALTQRMLARTEDGSAAVVARRYLFRHLTSIAPEGLTERHLDRSHRLALEWGAVLL